MFPGAFNWMRGVRTPWVAFACASLAACGGGGDSSGGSEPAPALYAIGGSISGLKGGGLSLQNNGGDALVVSANGTFEFAARQATGTNYSVTVKTQPVSPVQACSVTSGTGSVAGARVDSIRVACIPVPLQWVDSVPAAGSTEVPRTGAIKLTFSAPPDPGTLAGNAMLTSAAGDVALSSSVAGRVVTFSPLESLRRALTYRLTITTGLRGIDGEELLAPVTIEFDTSDGQWIEARTFQGAPAYSPRVGLDRAGLGHVIWHVPFISLGRTAIDLMSSHMDTDHDWTTPVIVSSGVGGQTPSCCASLSTAENGDAVLAWHHEESSFSFNARAAFFSRSPGWSSPVSLGAPIPYAYEMEVLAAASPEGDSVVTFNQGNNVYSSWRPANGEWEPTHRFEPSPRSYADNRSLGFNGASSGYSLTSHHDGDRFGLYLAQFSPTIGWSPPAPVPGASNVEPQSTLAAGDPDGNVWVAWSAAEELGLMIEAARRGSNGVWSDPVHVGPDSGALRIVGLSAAKGDHALVLWVTSPGSSERIWASRHSPGTGWTTEEKLQSVESYVMASEGLIEPGGNALVVWEQSGTIWASRYTSRTGWQPEIIDSGIEPDLAMNADGKFILAYSQVDGSRRQIKVRFFD